MNYDHQGRLVTVSKMVNGGVNPAVFRIISQKTYDGPGPGKEPATGTAAANTNPLEQMDYNYTIRGWLKGINWDYISRQSTTQAKAGRTFTMDLMGYQRLSELLRSTG